eukprot:302282_1
MGNWFQTHEDASSEYTHDSKKETHSKNGLEPNVTFNVPFDSKHLLSSSIPQLFDNDADRKECDLLRCRSLIRLSKILLHYAKSIDLDKIYPFNYDNSDLLNDFQHLLVKHCDQYEDIYKILTKNDDKSCDITMCNIIRRNNRDRQEISKNCLKMLEMYDAEDLKDIMKQQLIDKIHCYYFHSFDIGYKITEQQRQNMILQANACIDEEKTYDALHDHLVKIITEQQYFLYKRFNNIKELQRLKNNKDINKPNKLKSIKIPSYDFGHRYFYDLKYNNSKSFIDTNATRRVADIRPGATATNPGYSIGDWFVSPKYKDLKEEVTRYLDMAQWYALFAKANHHVITNYAKSMKLISTGFQSGSLTEALEYALQQRKRVDRSIGVEHIISVMIYCNFDNLSNKFSSTYRHLPEDDPDDMKNEQININVQRDMSMKKRHCSFANLGKRLKESVELLKQPENAPNTLYHGVNAVMQLSSTCTYMFGPISTTAVYSVAVAFCNNTGMILEFNARNYTSYLSRIKGRFTCHWLSDFANEQEILFIGGYEKMMGKEIIIPNGTNYCLYVNALRKLANHLDIHATVDELDETDKKMIWKLVSHQMHKLFPDNDIYHEFKSIPPFIDTLLANQCKHTSEIELFSSFREYMNKLYKYCKFCDEKECADLNIIMSLFPSVKKIMITRHWQNDIDAYGYISNPDVYDTVLQYLHKYGKRTSLQEIMICFKDNKLKQFARRIVEKYNKGFLSNGWTIYLDHNQMFKDVYIRMMSLDEECAKSQLIEWTQKGFPNFEQIKKQQMGELAALKMAETTDSPFTVNGKEYKIITASNHLQDTDIEKPELAYDGIYWNE